MSTVLKKCRFLTTAGGTGNFAVASAVAGFVTPASAGAEDAVVYRYYAFHGAEWELGEGAYTVATATVARTIVVSSSNNDAKISFSAAPSVVVLSAVNLAVRDGDNVWTGSNEFSGILVTSGNVEIGTDSVTVGNVEIGTDAITNGGVQVVGARATGWTAPTGTTQKGSFATFSAAARNNPPSSTDYDDIYNALQDASRSLAAVIAALTTHGLIGPTP